MANVHEEKAFDNSTKEAELYPSSDEADVMERAPSPQPSAFKGRTLDFNHGDFPWRDVVIQDSNSSNPQYFADVSEYSKNSPDVVLHTHSGDGPIVGQARFRWSRSIQCGIGSDELSMNWVEMKRSGALHKKQFQFTFDGKTYSLLRTRDAEHGVGGMKRILTTHYKVVEEKSGEVVAYYASQSTPGRKKGTLTIKEGVNQNLETLVILTIVSIREKGRRRAHYTAGGAGGGGGT